MVFSLQFYDETTNTITAITHTKAAGVVLNNKQIIIFPCDPTSASLYDLEPTKKLLSYTVVAMDDETIVSEERTFYLDYVERPDEKCFAYLNSLGGIDHIRCTGKIHPKVDFTGGNSERDPELIIPDSGPELALYDPEIPLMREFNLEESESIRVFSGPKTYREVDCFRDFKLSPLKFEFLHWYVGRYLPIIIDQKSINLPKTSEYPFTYDFVYKYAYRNPVYTPQFPVESKK
jgi:hypothetical protein